MRRPPVSLCVVLAGPLLIALASGIAPSPPGSDGAITSRLIPPDSLLGDFTLLRDALWEAHPRLFHYGDSARVTAVFDSLQALITAPMTALEFHRLAAEAVAAIGDGHTQLRLDSAATPSLVLPIELDIEAGGAWVRHTWDPAGPPVGARVLTLDGQPIADVISLAMRRMPRDWSLSSGRRAELRNRFAEHYSDLVHAPDRFVVEAEVDGRRRTYRLDGMARSLARMRRHVARDTLPIAWRLLEPGIAYIKLASFNEGNFRHVGRAFRSSFDSAMAFVHTTGAQDLVLDLRGNGGGEAANGAHAASHLLDRPFRYLESITARTGRLPKLERSQWAGDTSAPGEYASLLRPRADGRFDVHAPWYSTDTVSPQSRTYTGRLIVITDGFVASTGSDFAAIMQAHHRAAFVGEMPGGSADGNASGLTARIRLPASGSTLLLPLFDFTLATSPAPKPWGAFPPDLPVPMRGEQAIDAALALARSRLNEIAPRLSAYFGALADDGDFQGVVLVRDAEGVRYARPFGYEDLAADRPHDIESRFGIASLTKTFTAAAVLRLRDMGRLGLDDPIARYLPDFPNAGAITIRQLLRHEAGLGEPPEPSLGDSLRVPAAADLVTAIGREPPRFAPGTSDAYSNAGYVVLARIVEVAAGSSFDQFIDREFLGPLNLSATGDRRSLYDESSLATPYFPGGPPTWLDRLPRRQAMHYLGSGSFFSTAEDLGRWGVAIASGRPVNLARESYPFGWGRVEVEGRPGLSQTGLTTGYVSALQVFPGVDRVIVLLSNVEHGAWTDWSRDAARIVLTGTEVTPPTRRASADGNLGASTVRRIAGRYRMNATRYVDIAFEDGQFWVRLNGHHRRHYMHPAGDGVFTLRSFSGTMRFAATDGTGRAPSFTWVLPASWGAPDEVYRREAGGPPP